MRPEPIRPEDFDRFWTSTLRALDAIDPQPDVQPVEDDTDVRINLERVSFASLGKVTN